MSKLKFSKPFVRSESISGAMNITNERLEELKRLYELCIVQPHRNKTDRFAWLVDRCQTLEEYTLLIYWMGGTDANVDALDISLKVLAGGLKREEGRDE